MIQITNLESRISSAEHDANDTKVLRLKYENEANKNLMEITSKYENKIVKIEATCQKKITNIEKNVQTIKYEKKEQINQNNLNLEKMENLKNEIQKLQVNLTQKDTELAESLVENKNVREMYQKKVENYHTKLNQNTEKNNEKIRHEKMLKESAIHDAQDAIRQGLEREKNLRKKVAEWESQISAKLGIVGSSLSVTQQQIDTSFIISDISGYNNNNNAQRDTPNKSIRVNDITAMFNVAAAGITAAASGNNNNNSNETTPSVLLQDGPVHQNDLLIKLKLAQHVRGSFEEAIKIMDNRWKLKYDEMESILYIKDEKIKKIEKKIIELQLRYNKIKRTNEQHELQLQQQLDQQRTELLTEMREQRTSKKGIISLHLIVILFPYIS